MSLLLCFYGAECFGVYVKSSIRMVKLIVLCFDCYGLLHEIACHDCVFYFHRSCVNMLCRRHNCNYLIVGDSIITIRVPRATTQRLHVRPCTRTLEGKWYNLKDYNAKKGYTSLGCAG